MKDVVVFDIDGCILEPHPERIAALDSKDWDTYHKLHTKDTVKPAGVMVYSAVMSMPGLRIFFVTGRSERSRSYTYPTLCTIFGQKAIERCHLLMRPNHISGKDMHDSQMKPHLLALNGVKPEDILIVFEDRNSMVAEWRRLGVTCYQTQLGDF